MSCERFEYGCGRQLLAKLKQQTSPNIRRFERFRASTNFSEQANRGMIPRPSYRTLHRFDEFDADLADLIRIHVRILLFGLPD